MKTDDRTNSAMILTARLMEARDAMERMHGNGWPAEVEKYGRVIREQMRRRGVSVLEASTRLAEKASADGQNMVSVMFLAVGVEIATTE